MASLKPASASLRHRMFTRGGLWIFKLSSYFTGWIHTLPNVNMPPEDFKVSFRGACSFKQALSLCLEQGYINTNNFSSAEGCSRNTQFAVEVDDFIEDTRYHCGAAVKTRWYWHSGSAKTGSVLFLQNTFSSSMKWSRTEWNEHFTWCVPRRWVQEIAESKSNNPATVNAHRTVVFFIQSGWCGPRLRFDQRRKKNKVKEESHDISSPTEERMNDSLGGFTHSGFMTLQTWNQSCDLMGKQT